jgi:RimJ/RimL family protein N-acetyltransferase
MRCLQMMDPGYPGTLALPTVLPYNEDFILPQSRTPEPHPQSFSMPNSARDPDAVIPNTGPAGLPGPEPLIGRHVTLERLTRGHYADLWEHIGAHADLWHWWPNGPYGTPAEFGAFLDEHVGKAPTLATYAVLPAAGEGQGRAAGLGFALIEDAETHRVAEMGLFFGPRLRRTREGTEVALLLGGLLLGRLGYRRLQWRTNAGNAASRRAAERYGFAYEGTHRQSQVVKGRNKDTSWYAILDGEWPACERALEAWLEDGNFDDQGRQRRRIEELRDSLREDSR